MRFYHIYLSFLSINMALCIGFTARYLANFGIFLFVDEYVPADRMISDIYLPIERETGIKRIPVRMSWYGEKFHGKTTVSDENSTCT